MLGAIAGDVIGSVHEGSATKTTKFPLFVPDSQFTDDTVLTCALADSYLRDIDYIDALHVYHALYPRAGYGGTFKMWASEKRRAPYDSWGNGSAMRASPAAFWADNLADVLDLATRSAAVTHDHPEGIKGARAVAACVFMARTGATKADIKDYVEREFDYFLDDTVAQIRPTYSFDVSCQGSVPQSIIAFLESTDFEDAVRLAIFVRRRRRHDGVHRRIDRRAVLWRRTQGDRRRGVIAARRTG